MIKRVFNYIRNPQILGNVMLNHISPLIKDDEAFLRMKWWLRMDYPLNLKNPQTFSEKIQWLKLYNRRPEYTTMVDKVKAKRWVAEQIGEQYIIQTLGVWERAEDVDFNNLPEQFVIKCNHNSGKGMYICRNKKMMDEKKVRRGLAKGLKQDYYIVKREWPYKDVERQIIAEVFLSEDRNDLTDYKFYCFGGEPLYCQVIKDRNTKETIDFFDMEWRHQDFIGLNPAAEPAIEPIKKPSKYDEMQEIARKLSKDIPFSRIDMYEVNGRVYFGEVTFFPASGFGVFHPRKWDYKLGEWIRLPNK